MKIAYLVSDYHAPSHTFVRREIAALRRLGETILPFGVRGDDDGSNREKRETVPTILGQSILSHVAAFLTQLVGRPRTFVATWLRALSHRPPGLRALIWSQFHFIEAVTLARMLRRTGAERLHSHFANSGAVVGMLAARLADIPWSVTLHGISETDYPAGYLLPDKLKTASFAAIASRFMKAQAMRVTDPAIWPRFHIVRCGIDMDAMPPRSPSGTASQTGTPPRIVCVGRLSAEKGYYTLIEAIERLNRASIHPQVTIVGDGPERGALIDAANAANIVENIKFAGALPETQTLARIAAADMLVLPSLMEGLPVVLMEAMAIGVPVVASRVAGIPELVEHGVTGLTFTPTDAGELA
ncbi:MAG: glycosyltransferase, partial [Pontixanthobacter sp.]